MIKNGFAGVMLGVVLFLASFAVLYWNEGRVDMSDIAKKATVIDARNVTANAAYEGLLVSATNDISADTLIGDDLYLKPGPWLSVNRKVEVFAWVEKTETVTRTSTDGETTDTEYIYSQEWVDEPADAKDFHEPEGHTNPNIALNDRTNTVPLAMVGQYRFSSGVITLPELESVALTPSSVSLTQNATLIDDAYVYVRESATGTYEEPQLGDLRIGYSGLNVPFGGTVFGKLDGTTINPFVTKKNDTLYRLFVGTHDMSLAQMHTEYTSALWGFRVFGFLMMWFGLALLFGPISMILDFVPILGKVGRAFIGFATFAVSLVLAGVTIVISAILHNIIAVIVIVALILIGLIAFGVQAKKKQLALHPEAAVK